MNARVLHGYSYKPYPDSRISIHAELSLSLSFSVCLQGIPFACRTKFVPWVILIHMPLKIHRNVYDVLRVCVCLVFGVMWRGTAMSACIVCTKDLISLCAIPPLCNSFYQTHHRYMASQTHTHTHGRTHAHMPSYYIIKHKCAIRKEDIGHNIRPIMGNVRDFWEAI